MMLLMMLQKTVTCQRSACSLLHVQKDFESGDEVLEDNMHADWRLSILSGMPDCRIQSFSILSSLYRESLLT